MANSLTGLSLSMEEVGVLGEAEVSSVGALLFP